MHQPSTTLENPSTQELAHGMFENLKGILGKNFPLIPPMGRAQDMKPIEFLLPSLEGELGEKQRALWIDSRITIKREALGPDTVQDYITLNLPTSLNSKPESICFRLSHRHELSELFFQRQLEDRNAHTTIWKFGASEERIEALRRSAPEQMIEKFLVLNQALAELNQAQ